MNPGLDRIDEVGAMLGPRDSKFLRRIYAEGLDKYRMRLDAIGFDKLGVVLDAGCGVGQWSMALVERSERVVGIDTSRARINTVAALARGASNLSFQRASINALPFPDACFDAIYCYSVLYYTDARRSVSELCRVLRPGGRLYLCSNGLGWYLYNLVAAPNPSPDFAPRRYAIDTLMDTLLYFTTGRAPRPGGSIVTPRRWLRRLLAREGMEEIASASEGGINLAPRADASPQSFFRGRYYGLEGVFEWLGRKRRVSSAGTRSLHAPRAGVERA